MKKQVEKFNQDVKGLSAVEILKKAKEIFKDEIVMASSLGAEDQLITHMIYEDNINITIFVLSNLIPGPIVDVIVIFFKYVPLAACGFDLRIAFTNTWAFSIIFSFEKETLPMLL